jgi:MFS transporter, PPP family, 3-phenylpropionic acid transporter
MSQVHAVECAENKSHLYQQLYSSNRRPTKRSFTRMSLLMLKIYFVTSFLGLGCVFPFLSMYYRSIGLTDQQIGVLTALMPVMNFITTPFWSNLADKYNNHQRVLQITSFISAIACLLFLFLKNISAGSSGQFFNALFLSTFALVSVFSFFFSPQSALLDVLVLRTLDKIGPTTGLDKQTLYGRQRVWGSVAYGGAGFFVSMLLKPGQNMDAIFYGYYTYLNRLIEDMLCWCSYFA